MSKTIAVIGGNFAASFAVDGILKALANNSDQFKIKVIAPKGSVFVVALPRAIVQPDIYPQINFDLSLRYKDHKNVEFINDRVAEADLDSCQLILESSGDTIDYDFLVIATGLKYKSPLFDRTNDRKITNDYFYSLVNQLKIAKSVAIVGGGATGIETAAEIAEKFPDKTVSLYTGSAGVIPEFPPSHVNKVTDHLDRLKVKIIKKRVISEEEIETTTKLVTDDGAIDTADVVINAVSGSPNTTFIKNKSVLDSKGFVLQEGLCIKGYSNAFVLGDIISGGGCTIVSLKMYQNPVFQQNIKTVLSGSTKPLKPFKESSSKTLLLPISSKGGVGLSFWMERTFVRCEDVKE